MAPTPPVTRQIAEFCAAALQLPIDQGTLAQAVNAVIDTIAVIVAGGTARPTTALLDALAPVNGSGSATVLATGERVLPHVAATINATAGHALDFDDHLGDVKGHPSVVLVPALLGVAEHHRMSGIRALRSYLVGHQVMCALAAALPADPHWRRGWHATATIGVVAAAAAVGSLLELDIAEQSSALGIAASMAAGSRQNCGFNVKAVHAGMAAGNGVLATRLAQHGIEADPGQLEAPLGYLTLFSNGDADPTVVADVLAERWTLTNRGVNVKRYPACYAVHPAAEAAATIHQSAVTHADIASINVTVHPTGLSGPIHHDPLTVDQARFSLEYAVAAALIDGHLTEATFSEDQLHRPDTRRLMRLVTSTESAVPPFGPPADSGWYAAVEVTTADGSVHRAHSGLPPGSARDPMPDHDVDQKFLGCVRRAGRTDGPALLTRLRDLPNNHDIGQLLDTH